MKKVTVTATAILSILVIVIVIAVIINFSYRQQTKHQCAESCSNVNLQCIGYGLIENINQTEKMCVCYYDTILGTIIKVV